MGLGLCLPDDLFPLLVYGFQVLFITRSDIFQFFLLLTDILPFAFPVPFIAYDILQVFVHIDIIRSDVRGSVGYHVLGQTDLACDLYGERATRVSDRKLEQGLHQMAVVQHGTVYDTLRILGEMLQILVVGRDYPKAMIPVEAIQ